MNPKSSAIKIQDKPSMVHEPVITASVSPVRVWSSYMLFLYEPLVENDRGSIDVYDLLLSLNVP